MIRTDVSPFDRHMMEIALRMARRGLGRTRPNPSVGAVIADERSDEVLARAVTAPGGRPHAETEAIAVAGERARGATIYVTLEPCAHHGQTAPCADAIIAAGLSRVVAAIEDADPRVAGRGLDRLRAAGLAVTRGVLASEARWVTRGHIVRVTERRPLVTLKMALNAGGDIARGGAGQPQWVTGDLARARGWLLRAEADAILVGAQTVRDDDPMLTCRLPGLADRSPVRIVLSRDLDVPLTSRLVQSARHVPVWIITSHKAPSARRLALIDAGVDVIDATEVQNQLWLPSVMEALVARGVTRLLVEGGPTVWRAFADAALVDEVALFMAARPDRPQTETEAHGAITRWLGSLPLSLDDVMDVAMDRLWRFRRRSTTEGA